VKVIGFEEHYKLPAIQEADRDNPQELVYDVWKKAGLALNRSAHRLDQGSRSLSPEDGVGSVVEIVEQVLDLWAGVQRVVAVVFQVPVAPVQRP
jgi:hypothetical protein